MNYTREQALEDCKVIWQLVYDGKAANKYEALDQLDCQLPSGRNAFDLSSNCPLCTYVEQFDGNDLCTFCPYYQKYGHCAAEPISYSKAPKEFAARIIELE